MKRIAAAFLCSLFLLAPASPLRAQVPTSTSTSANDNALVALVRQRIKHVFVIYQENRSFDSYFGTFPGAENLTSAVAQSQGFKQYDPLGNQWVTPFRITAADSADADHSRPALITKADNGRMDLFVSTEEFGLLARGYSREDAQRVGLLTMAFEDCDTIPYLWMYAHNFTLFDHFFQGMYGPSTPGNIDLIAAQTGQTEWARHATLQVNARSTGPGVPVVNDVAPAFGPYGNGVTPLPEDAQDDLTFATLFLTLSGKNATQAKRDNDDIKEDIVDIAHRGHPAVPWGWYQEGFASKPGAFFNPYITHHNALQYFGYLRQNDYFWRGVHDLKALIPTIEQGKLGDRGVVFVKGGYVDPFGFKPADKSAYVQQHFQGDDDHPGYSDSQVSEAMVAKVVNAIAKSKYWKDSLILITYDDSEGFYDHMSPPQFERCPDGHPCGDGPRVPAIIISPFSKDHAIVSEVSDHASFAKMLGKIFDLPALASLPDESPYLPEGPRDLDPRLSDLLGAFDPERLAGTKLPIPAADAIVPDVGVPPKMSCSSLGIVPAVIPGENAPPPGFAPLTLEH
ncbi:MAG: phosphoesterase [bacterium]|nr:phosphoesterase [bacterium]